MRLGDVGVGDRHVAGLFGQPVDLRLEAELLADPAHQVGERGGLGAAQVTTNLQSSAFYVLTGFHGVHVTIGILMLLSLYVMSVRGNLPTERSETVEIVGLYWHFVDIVWILIFTVVYLIT